MREYRVILTSQGTHAIKVFASTPKLAVAALLDLPLIRWGSLADRVETEYVEHGLIDVWMWSIEGKDLRGIVVEMN